MEIERGAKVRVRAGTAIRAGTAGLVCGSAATCAPLTRKQKARKTGAGAEGGVHNTHSFECASRSVVEFASGRKGPRANPRRSRACGVGGHARSAHLETKGAQNRGERTGGAEVGLTAGEVRKNR